MSPFSSKIKQRSKSPSKATPKSAFSSRTTFAVASRFSINNGFGTPLGNVPSGLLFTFIKLNGKRFSSSSIAGPAAPLPEFTTIFNGFKALIST